MSKQRLRDKYLSLVKEYLGTEDVEVEETDFGLVIIKGNWRPPRGEQSPLQIQT